jgi:hypothetical protein
VSLPGTPSHTYPLSSIITYAKSKAFTRAPSRGWKSAFILRVQPLIGTQDWKIDRLNSLVKSLRIDIVAGCETNVNWHLIDNAHQLLDLLVPGTGKRGVVSHNTTNDIMQCAQQGGTAIAALGRLCDVISSTGGLARNHTDLGRYSWIRLGNEEVSTVFVSAYVPCKPSSSKGETFWDQCRYFHEAGGDFRDL